MSPREHGGAMNGPAPLEVSTRTEEALQRILREEEARVLIRGATVISMDPQVGDLTEGDVCLEGSKILAVGADLGELGEDGPVIVVDARGCVLIPGLVDSHRHCWQTHTRRLVPDGDVMDYVGLMHAELAPAYRPEDMYLGTRLGALGALDSGITCVLDFSHNTRSPGYSDAVVRAWKDSGMRGVIASAAPMAGEWNHAWLADLGRVRAEQLSDDDGLVTLRMGVLAGAIDGIAGELLVSADSIRRARDLGIAVSIDGTFGLRSGERMLELEAAGVLGPDITWIHCTAIGDDAWRVIADSGGAVALAMTSDQQLAIGDSVGPIQKCLDFGIQPSLSVDVECALATDLFTQMQAALNTQRMLAGRRRFEGDAEAPKPISVRSVLEYATVGGAKANGVWDRCGSITPGKEGDLVLIRANDINNLPLNNAVATVVLGADARNVDTVFVAGRPRKWGGSLVDVDLADLRSRILASRDRMFAEIGYDLDIVA
jgi:cytosine/adenosine deaminase-related metal-dependent hydrolase